MSDLNITIGIELEFTVVYPPDAFAELDDSAERDYNEDNELEEACEYRENAGAGHAIWSVLKANTIPVSGYEELGTSANEKQYSTWCVHEDHHGLLPEEFRHLPEGWKWAPIEISSPAMAANGDWQRQVGKVLQLFDAMRARYGCEFLINTTTGFHCHVGNNFGEDIPLDTIKRVLQLTTAYESRIDTLHHANRIRAPGLTVAPFDNPTRPDPQHTHVPSEEASEDPLYAPLSFFHNSHAEHDDGSNIFSWLE